MKRQRIHRTAEEAAALASQRAAEAAGARAEVELELKAERAYAAVRMTVLMGRCAVLTEKDATTKPLQQGVRREVGDNNVLWLPAEDNIQGASLGVEHQQQTLQAISTLRRASGFVIVAFDGVNFKERSNRGTSGIIARVQGLIEDQDAREAEQRRTRDIKQQPDILERTKRLRAIWHPPAQRAAQSNAAGSKSTWVRDFGVLLVGPGEPSDLPTHHTYDHGADSEFLALFKSRLVLLDTGELASSFPEKADPDVQAAPEGEDGQLGLQI